MREAERQLVQRLKGRCQQQARHLGLVQEELRRAVCAFQALAVSTQYFSRKVRPRLVHVRGPLVGREGSDGDGDLGGCVFQFGSGVRDQFDVQKVLQNPSSDIERSGSQVGTFCVCERNQSGKSDFVTLISNGRVL